MTQNQKIAELFSRAADVLALLDENAFRVLATRKVGRILEDMAEDVSALVAAGKLEEIPGIGAASADKIREYVRTGRITEFEQIAASVPAGVLKMMAIPSVGPKTAHLLWKEGNITTLEELKAHLTSGTFPKIKGLGEKKQLRIQENLAFMESSATRIGIGWALPLANDYLTLIRAIPGVDSATFCGSLRRGKETVGDIDILIAAEAELAAPITRALRDSSLTGEIIAAGETKISLRATMGLQVDFRLVKPENWGAALQYFTGSREHNVRLRELAEKKGWKLNEWGLFDGQKAIAGKTEEGIYSALGLAFIEPERREDRGELELARAMHTKDSAHLQGVRNLEFLKSDVPTHWEILDAAQFCADLHMHTTDSDGNASLEEMVAKARSRGYSYIAITNHSKSQVQANGLSAARLLEHVGAIRRLNALVKDMTILAGSEVDILADGSLDYPDEILTQLDWVVASPHMALSQESQAATNRMVKAASNPLVDVIGHPTGRLIGGRKGLEMDISRLVFAAARSGTALEINATDQRLDLRDTHARLAIEAHVPLCINTDAHSTQDMDRLTFGILTARRAWARAENIVNTWPLEKMLAWQKRRRAAENW